MVNKPAVSYIVFAILFLPPTAFLGNATSIGSVADFMTMDVCIDAQDIVTDAIPGDADCLRSRDIRPGETPHYVLQNFSAPSNECTAGTVSKVNVPIQRGGNVRIVSSTIRQKPCSKNDSGNVASDPGENGASIQWFDDEYGFIMGSYSPVSLSAFESDRCTASPFDSRRFFRGWVIGPKDVPAVGTVGFGVFPSKLKNGEEAANFTTCAARYNRALTTWYVNEMSYKSGRKLTSLVSSHYARGASDGKSPGNAMQMEQTYWTREFGLSRWEKWARSDWVHPRSKRSAFQLAKGLVAASRCSLPTIISLSFNPQMQLPAQFEWTDGVYSRVIRNALTGEQHVWYMTLCEDYTNAARDLSPSSQSLEAAEKFSNENYWK